MKKNILSVLVLLIVNLGGVAQDKGKVETGTLNCADFKILIPENYQNKLVMFAHGYSMPGSPSTIEGDQLEKISAPFLERGFAIAASEYAYQGYALPQGVDDTEDLRQYFWDVYGKPDSTFMTGFSMGGGITIAMMENFSKYYNGALAMCPLSSRPYLQSRHEFDIHALFDVLFPGIIPPLSEIVDINNNFNPTGLAEIEKKIEVINNALKTDEQKATELARQFNLNADDLAVKIVFGEVELRDVAIKSGGNPFDNTNTIYTGFSNDWEINKNIVRLEATANPDNIFERYDFTGNIGKPVVLMHTIYDPIIPANPYGEVNFENMVHQQGKDHFLTVKICNGQGHCAFTPEQIGQAFDELRHWVKTGEKVKPGVME